MEGESTLRLGEAGFGTDNGRVGALNLLAYAGLPVPEGVVLTRRAHEEFLLTSGILREIRGASRRRAAEIRPGYGSSPVEGELNRTICEALIGLSEGGGRHFR
jgi:phosphoenolpyruvate synthase/pyruvate phosphate dikinase